MGGGGFGTCKMTPLPHSRFEDNVDEGIAVLEVLEFINQYWETEVKYLPEWWKEMKEANEYQEDIDAHEGKVKRSVEVWVDEK